MISKPKSSTTGTGTGVSNPNTGSGPNTQSFTPSNPTSKNPYSCIDNCGAGDIQCMIKCISGGAELTPSQMATINNIQSLFNQNKKLTDQFKTNIQNSRTQADALRSYQSYYNQNISAIKALNDPNFNSLLNAAQQKSAEVNSKLSNRDLTSNILNGANVNSTVLSLADKNRIIGDITFGKKWDDFKECLKKGGAIGAGTGALGGGGLTGSLKHGVEGAIGGFIGGILVCAITVL